MEASKSLLYVFAAMIAVAMPAVAQETAPTSAPGGQPKADEGILPLPDYTGDIWNRSTLTGDWGGARSQLAAKGLTLDAYAAQVYQGPFSGGRNTDAEYGGRANILFNLDTGRMGLWPGGLFTVEAEGKFGKTANGNTGALIPVNSNGLFPQPFEDDWAIPSVMYTQFLSEQFGVFFGKLDTMSGDDNAFAHGKGNEQFMNLSFGINPAALVGTPYSTLGGGLILLPTKDIQASFLVYDPNGQAGTSGFSSLYKDGPGYGLEGRVTTHFFDLTGHQLLGGGYSTKNYVSLNQPLRNLIIPFLPAKQASNTWSLYYNFDQYFYQPEKDIDRGMGVFARVGISDGEANPVHQFVSIGVGGKGMLPGRKYDQCGIGYYYLWATLPQRTRSLGLIDEVFDRNTQGLEAFYELAITPWAHLTGDLQVIEPSANRIDTTWVAGLRIETKF